jgi:hypothetical protein
MLRNEPGGFEHLLTFRRFRLHVVGFLRLPLTSARVLAISESALRNAIKMAPEFTGYRAGNPAR